MMKFRETTLAFVLVGYQYARWLARMKSAYEEQLVRDRSPH
jgi:hypothetical protein